MISDRRTEEPAYDPMDVSHHYREVNRARHPGSWHPPDQVACGRARTQRLCLVAWYQGWGPAARAAFIRSLQ
jgi:hypothetical protein